MKIKHNVALKALNSFSIDVNAQRLLALRDVAQLPSILKEIDLAHNTLILGAGSNILFVNDVSSLIIFNQLKGIRELAKDDEFVLVEAAGGENWHDFVRLNLSRGYSGIENLSMIPGTVGAAPIQNIGAYGVELSDTFFCLQALDLETGQSLTMDANDCKFSYRNSVFKSDYPGRYLITSVTFRLNKQYNPQLNYSGVKDQLALMGIDASSATAAQTSDAICALRSSKLPDPSILGSAGSFFKNPIVNSEQYKKLQADHPSLTGFLTADAQYKLSAAWLIDQCGFKGIRRGDAGVYEKHALVLVNYGNASGKQIWQLAKDIQNSIEGKFNIRLEPEPNIWI